MSTGPVSLVAPATPTTTAAVDTMPSLAPSTPARSQFSAARVPGGGVRPRARRSLSSWRQGRPVAVAESGLARRADRGGTASAPFDTAAFARRFTRMSPERERIAGSPPPRRPARARARRARVVPRHPRTQHAFDPSAPRRRVHRDDRGRVRARPVEHDRGIRPAIVSTPVSNSAPGAALSVTPVGSYDTGIYKQFRRRDRAGLPRTALRRQRAGGQRHGARQPRPQEARQTVRHRLGRVANSVAVRDDGPRVVAFEAKDKTAPGHLVFFDANKDDARPPRSARSPSAPCPTWSPSRRTAPTPSSQRGRARERLLQRPRGHGQRHRADDGRSPPRRRAP